MRVLLIDHGCCDPPASRVHRLRDQLARLGLDVMGCGPASVPPLEASIPGLHGIHLIDIAAANRRLLAAVHEGSAAAFLAALAGISPRLLGLVRETARQTIAEAVDAFDPDVIFVLHAGILADLAIETGVPVVVHVCGSDLESARGSDRLRELVAAAVGSAELIVAETADTAGVLAREWCDAESAAACEVWQPEPRRILAACGRARERRP